MDLFPLPGALPPDPVGQGWARIISNEPRTVSEVLDDARRSMDAEDEAERQAADPLAWLRASRRKNLLTRLLHGRH